jgi:hypothetical protein
MITRVAAGLVALGIATTGMAGCTQDDAPVAPPPPGAVSGAPDGTDGTDACGARANVRLIGLPLSDPSVPPASRKVRHIRPGDAVTEDYRIERLNIYVTGADVIEKINCG